jgi:hypothetical protein
MNVQELRDEVLKLSPQERKWLLLQLRTSVEDREISPEEGAEWQRRLQDMVSGRVQGINLEDTLARGRKELKKIRETKNQPLSR